MEYDSYNNGCNKNVPVLRLHQPSMSFKVFRSLVTICQAPLINLRTTSLTKVQDDYSGPLLEAKYSESHCQDVGKTDIALFIEISEEKVWKAGLSELMLIIAETARKNTPKSEDKRRSWNRNRTQICEDLKEYYRTICGTMWERWNCYRIKIKDLRLAGKKDNNEDRRY